jgi:ribosome-binding protein aMBF1 (putative translation factor)
MSGTCATCDCELDENPIKVALGGNAVEVCRDDCAEALREADASQAQGSGS